MTDELEIFDPDCTPDLVREVHEFERQRMDAIDAAQYKPPSRLERIKATLSRKLAQARGLSGANPYATLPILLDLSHWNGTNHNWDALRGRIIAVVHKLGEVDDADDTNDRWNDSAFQTNFGGSAGAGIPSIAYFFDDCGAYACNHNWKMDDGTPIWNDPKLKVIIRQLAYNPHWEDDPTVRDGKRLVVNGWRPFRAIVIDVERHWLSYTEYAKFNRGEIGGYRQLTPAWIDHSVKMLAGRLDYLMSKNMMKRVPIMIYSRKSFIDQYSPILATTLYNRSEWLKWPAHYVVGAGNVSTTIEEIRAKYIPAETFRHKEIYGPSTFWQWSGDRYRIPECPGSAVDLNFYMGTPEMFARVFGEVVTPPPPPPVDPPVPDEWRAEVERRLTALEAAPVKAHTHVPGGVA